MLTQEQWFKKLSGFVPSWVLQEDKNAYAHYQGMAKVLSVMQSMVDDHIKETFITTSSGEFLDLHGADRNKVRTSSDTDESFKAKIREIVNSCSLPALKALVDSMLINGETTIVEHYAAENFCNAGAFLNVNVVPVQDYLYNFITIIVNQQIPEPSTFADVDAFCNTAYITGANESDIKLFESIVNAVNENKALGIEYRLIERR